MLSLCTRRMVFAWTVLSGLLLTGAFVLAFWGMPKIIKNQIHAQTELKQETEQWDRFEELPFKLNYSIRFFNVKNPIDVLTGDAPDIEETKPYKYKLSLKRTNITFDDFDEASVTYTRVLGFEFDDSNGNSNTDEVTILNPLLMSSLQLTSTIRRLALVGCLTKLFGDSKMNEVFITKSVQDLLFDGIPFGVKNDNVGYACEYVRKLMVDVTDPIRVVEHLNNTDDGSDSFRIAFLNYKTQNYQKKPYPDGIYTANTGVQDMKSLGSIMRWNGVKTITKYGRSESINNATCQDIKGTDGTIFHPILNDEQTLDLFITDLCRTVTVNYKKAETYKDIVGRRYETDEYIFRHQTLLADNDCFCMKASKDVDGKDSCFLDGVFDFKPCLGAPILISLPHFLYADEKYSANYSIFNPNEENHNNFAVLEPNTGTPLRGGKRMQMNSILKTYLWTDKLIPTTTYKGLIPLFWLSEEFELPDTYVDYLKDNYFKKVRIASAVKYTILGVFAAIFTALLYFSWRKQFIQ